MTLIYKTPYTAADIRSNYRSMWFTTVFATGMLAFFHPALPLVLAYDYWLLLGATKVLNRTSTMILLDVTKRHLWLNKLNFLGYYREESRHKVNLNKIKYMGEFENTFITMGHMGLLPSMQRMFWRDREESKEKKQGDFRYFVEFMADNERFLLAIDHPDHKDAVPSDVLLDHVVNGR